MNPIIKKSSEFANEMFDSVAWLIRRLESPGKNVNLGDARGKTAEVSTTIEPGRAGEILLPLGGSVANYSARGSSENMRLLKGTKVRIVDVMHNTMSVEPVAFMDSSF
jgi:membrane protein implicated in regulation of membrane protease activity